MADDPISTTTTTTTTTSPPVQACAQCAQTPTALKQCLKCHSTAYCNKDCQKRDFKAHKKVCARLAQEYSQTHAAPKMATRAPPRNDARDRGLQKWQFDT